MTGANLIGIDLTGVNVQNAIFIGAIYDSSTVLPFDPVAAGMVPIPEMSPLLMMMLGLLTLSALRRELRHRPMIVQFAA